MLWRVVRCIRRSLEVPMDSLSGVYNACIRKCDQSDLKVTVLPVK